jgi:hypothetical protein
MGGFRRSPPVPLARRLALALLWIAAPAEALLAARLGLGWEATLLAGLVLAGAATAGMRRRGGDLVLAAALMAGAALAMGWLLAADRPGLALLPPLLVLALTFMLGRALPFVTAAAGTLALIVLPLLAGGAEAQAGLRVVLLAGAVLLAVALRPPRRRPAAPRPIRPTAPVLGGGALPSRPLPAEEGLMLRAERRADGALALALGLAAPPPGGLRVRVAPP